MQSSKPRKRKCNLCGGYRLTELSFPSPYYRGKLVLKVKCQICGYEKTIDDCADDACFDVVRGEEELR